MKKTTLQDVANYCNISLAVASRVINNKPRVSDTVRKRVLDAVEKLNYRNRGTMGKKQVALLLEPVMNLRLDPYSFLIMSAIYNKLSQKEYYFQAINSTDFIDSYSFSALITIAPVNRRILSWGEEFGIPMIAINTPGSRRENIYSIYSNEKKAMEEAIAELYAHGHRKIGLLLCSGLETWATHNRIAGFSEAMRQRNLVADDFVQECYSDEETYFYKPLGALLHRDITALICPGEGGGQRIVHALAQYGYKIPEDISVIAWEVPGVSEFNLPSLTTMEQDYDGLADQVVALLDGLQNQKFVNNDIVVDYRFNKRGSIGKI